MCLYVLAEVTPLWNRTGQIHPPPNYPGVNWLSVGRPLKEERGSKPHISLVIWLIFTAELLHTHLLSPSETMVLTWSQFLNASTFLTRSNTALSGKQELYSRATRSSGQMRTLWSRRRSLAVNSKWDALKKSPTQIRTCDLIRKMQI